MSLCKRSFSHFHEQIALESKTTCCTVSGETVPNIADIL